MHVDLNNLKCKPLLTGSIYLPLEATDDTYLSDFKISYRALITRKQKWVILLWKFSLSKYLMPQDNQLVIFF